MLAHFNLKTSILPGQMPSSCHSSSEKAEAKHKENI
jgi:hypothetical protein